MYHATSDDWFGGSCCGLTWSSAREFRRNRRFLAIAFQFARGAKRLRDDWGSSHGSKFVCGCSLDYRWAIARYVRAKRWLLCRLFNWLFNWLFSRLFKRLFKRLFDRV